MNVFLEKVFRTAHHLTGTTETSDAQFADLVAAAIDKIAEKAVEVGESALTSASVSPQDKATALAAAKSAVADTARDLAVKLKFRTTVEYIACGPSA